MSVELQVDDGAGPPAAASEDILGSGSPERRHPHVSGDLPTVLTAAPMFRRVVAGYDRFEVDTYVRWAEDELATADRERERLEARHLQTRSALEEARQLLAHSSEGGQFLQSSRRMGSLLAAAADEAESIRSEAAADRCAARADAEATVARADQVLADAVVAAERKIAEAATEAAAMTAEADRIVLEAEATGERARVEAEARLERVSASEQRAAAHADATLREARAEAAAATLRARDEVVRMLGTARDERRRADAEGAATRDRLDRAAATRRAALLAELEVLEHRRSALRAEVELLAAPVAATTDRRLEAPLRRLLDRLGRPRSLRTH
jgi:cell division septum initiation protein DivIVA